MAPLLFHKDVYIPDFAKVPLFEGEMKYGRHAQHVTAEGGEHAGVPLPSVFIAKEATLIEVELNPETGAVEKQVWRQRLNDEWDMCFPMIADGFIKTVWLNRKTDTHKTLNKAKFIGGSQWRNMRNKLKPKSN